MLSDAETKFINQWEKTKFKGKLRYIFLVGVLGWGVPMFIVMTLIIGSGLFPNKGTSVIIINSVIWLIGGFVFGYSGWYYADKKYNKLAAKRLDKGI